MSTATISETADTAAPPPQRDDAAADDPLLACLAYLTQHYGRPFSAEVLRAGLPQSGRRLDPGLILRAAGRAGFVARVASRDVSRLDRKVLPAIVLLRGGNACVLLETGDDGRAVVMYPETGGGVTDLPLADLAAEHDGTVIFVRPEYRPPERRTDRRTGAWLWNVLAENWWVYAQVVVAAVLINLFALVSPIFIMTVYNRVVPNDALDTLWVLALGALIVLGFDLLVRLLRSYYIDVAGRRADVVLAGTLFDRILDLQLGARPKSAGALANTLREFESVRDFFTSATLTALVDLPFALFFILVIWWIGGPVALVPAVAVPVVIIAGLIVQVPLSRAVRRSYGEAEAKHGVLFETLGGLETVKAVGAEGRMRHKWETLVALGAQSGIRARQFSQIALNFSSFVQQVAGIGVVVYGVLLISAGDLTVGGLIACVILSGRTVGALSQVAQLLVRIDQARTSFRALDAIMNLPVERPDDRTFLHRPRLAGDILFREVAFTYPQQPMAALRNVSFHIRAGERVGVIGRVGSGKTTLQKLVLGLYQPDSGAIQVDGTDLRQIDPIDLRRNIGCVPQDVVLFAGTMRENITIGAPFANDEALRRAAVIAGAEDFVSQHPLGYDLKVGERGEGLSGGQRQAVAIARALLADPPILLFDEPTSSMDNAAEKTFTTRLQEILPGKTLVLVTHRASLLGLVDRLIVLDRGQVVADGPKQKVLEALADGRIAVLGT